MMPKRYNQMFLKTDFGHVNYTRFFVILTKLCKMDICLTSVTRVKCGVHSTLCQKIGNISCSTELF